MGIVEYRSIEPSKTTFGKLLATAGAIYAAITLIMIHQEYVGEKQKERTELRATVDKLIKENEAMAKALLAQKKRVD